MPNNRSKIYNGKLYYGGGSSVYTSTGTVNVGWVGVWDGTPGATGWSSLDGGIQTGYGRGLHVVDENHIYLFGKYSSIGQTVNVNPGYEFNIARWNGTSWSAIGTVGSTNNEVKDAVYDAVNNVLYAVGTFTSIYGVAANRVAKFQNGVWSPLAGGANSTVETCRIDRDGNLYIIGSFGGVTNGAFVNNTSLVARWNRTTAEWESIGSVNGQGWDLEYDPVNHQMYVSGVFSGISSVANTRNLARYDIGSGTWESIATFDVSDSTVYDICYMGGGRLYIVGNFNTHGDDAAYFNGNSWQGLGMNDGYTLNPTQTSFVPIDLSVDSNGNMYIDRNAGGFYILLNGETQWNRLDQLGAPVTIGQAYSQGVQSLVANNSQCFHPDSCLPVVRSGKYLYLPVREIVAGDGLIDEDGQVLRVERLIQIFPNQRVKFYRVSDSLQLSGLHYLKRQDGCRQSSGLDTKGRPVLAWLAGLPCQKVVIDVMYHIQTDGNGERYFIPVSPEWKVEVWGRRHRKVRSF